MPDYYFDHAASAPRRDDVTEAMAPWMHGVVGNPSGSHHAARAARRAVEEARDEVAALVGAEPGNVIFTAGGTESCTLAVAGFARAHRQRGARNVIVTSAIEHHAVLDAATMVGLEPDLAATSVGVDADGVLDVAELEQVLDAGDVRLVSVMTANNETGVLQPLGAVVERCDARGVFTHTDAVAAAPWCDLREITRGVDMVSLCAHKLGGPVNAGALVLRKGTLLEALTPGGGQERGRRGGTVDVAACVGLATALRLANAERELAWTEVGARRDALAARLTALEGVRVTAPSVAKLPGTLHLTFEGVASDELLFLLDRAGVCASAAASCSSGAAVASHVLAAMGMAPERARGSLRLSMGLENSAQECDDVATIIEATVARLRGRHVA